MHAMAAAPASPSRSTRDARRRGRPRAARVALVVAAVAAALHGAATARADEPEPEPASRHGVQEWGVKLGYGTSKQGQTEVMPVYAQAGWALPDAVDIPLRRWNIDLKWLVEGWMAGVHTPRSDAFELGINPVTFKIAYDAGQQFVPFFQAGVGVMYTSLQDGLSLGGPFEFNEVFGGGLQMFCNDQFALSISYRFRHISNAGISSENSGLDTNFVLLGIDFHPGR